LTLWQNGGLVTSFHFLHYLDPDYHLRLRFYLSDSTDAGKILNQIHISCDELLVEDLIWKVEVGTYEPEYERYGEERMSMVESWFEIDSLFWLEEVYRQSKNDTSDIWRCAARSIDVFLEDFGLNIDGKIKVVSFLRKSSIALFGLNTTMKGQLDNKYRKLSENLSDFIENGIEESDEYLIRRSIDIKGFVSNILSTFETLELLVESQMLPDLIHMSLNRAFRTRHRMQELVVYDFLGRYYESKKAKEKKVTN